MPKDPKSYVEPPPNSMKLMPEVKMETGIQVISPEIQPPLVKASDSPQGDDKTSSSATAELISTPSVTLNDPIPIDTSTSFYIQDCHTHMF